MSESLLTSWSARSWAGRRTPWTSTTSASKPRSRRRRCWWRRMVGCRSISRWAASCSRTWSASSSSKRSGRPAPTARRPPSCSASLVTRFATDSRNITCWETPAQASVRTGARRSVVAVVGPPVEGPRERSAVTALRLATLLRRDLVDRGSLRRQHDAIGPTRDRRGDLAVQHVRQHRHGIAVERVAIPGAAGDVLPELIARVEHDHLLGRQRFARAVLAQHERARPGAWRAAFEAPRRRREALATVRDQHVRRGGLEDLLEAQTAAEPPGASRVPPHTQARDPPRAAPRPPRGSSRRCSGSTRPRSRAPRSTPPTSWRPAPS